MIKYQIWYMKPSFLRGVVGSSPDLGVFTQSGSKVDLTPQKCDFGSSPMCGLRVGKDFLHVLQHWSVQPCVRPLGAVHMTAGHNALRGSGPNQTDAFNNALTQVGCPDRRIDRLCNTCCPPSPTYLHITPS